MLRMKYFFIIPINTLITIFLMPLIYRWDYITKGCMSRGYKNMKSDCLKAWYLKRVSKLKYSIHHVRTTHKICCISRCKKDPLIVPWNVLVSVTPFHECKYKRYDLWNQASNTQGMCFSFFFVARAFSIIMKQKKNNRLILWAIDTTICVQHKTASERIDSCVIYESHNN